MGRKESLSAPSYKTHRKQYAQRPPSSSYMRKITHEEFLYAAAFKAVTITSMASSGIALKECHCMILLIRHLGSQCLCHAICQPMWETWSSYQCSIHNPNKSKLCIYAQPNFLSYSCVPVQCHQVVTDLWEFYKLIKLS